MKLSYMGESLGHRAAVLFGKLADVARFAE
jgi:hypothetical protein